MTDGDASEQPGKDDQPPRVFVSYSDDSAAHARRVLELAQWLRSHGVDAQIDQFEESPEEGWPRWIYRQIREAEFVLIIATPEYLRRCESDEPRVDATGSATKFGSHLTLQELHEAGGRNRKFVPVLFGDDAIVESVPLPLRGATCYRLPDQRDDLYRRLTGQPKVQRAPLGMLKTFDDESFADGDDDLPLVAEPLARGRASLDEQHADDSLRAIVDAGIVDDREDDRPSRRRQRRHRSKRQWLITAAAFGVAFMSVGLFMGRRFFVPEAEPICRIQLTDADGRVVEGIDRVDLELPSGHLIEVVVEDGRTLRFACPPSQVQAQAHVYLDKLTETASQASDPELPRDVALRIDGRVALPAGIEVGDEVAQTELIKVVPARPIEPKPQPEYGPEPGPIEPAPVLVPGSVEVDGGEGQQGSAEVKLPSKRVPKVTPLSKDPELQSKLSDQIVELRRCYERGLTDNPSLRGQIVGEVQVDASGLVNFKIISNEFSRKSPEVAACIREKIESWKLGKPKNPRGTVERVSIEFAPPT